MYIDDYLIFAKTADIINKLIASLHTDFTLTDEGDINGFLCIDVKNLPDGSYELTQPRFIDCTIKEVRLKDESKEHAMPCQQCWNYYPKMKMAKHVNTAGIIGKS